MLDGRSDVYSLGATLYELVTLRAALAATIARKSCDVSPSDEPRPLRRLNPAIPADSRRSS